MKNYDTIGTEVLVDLYGCKSKKLNDVKNLIDIAYNTIEIAEVQPVKTVYHQFVPQGITISIIISESSFTIHTYPEHRYVTANLYTCGKKAKPEKAMKYFVNAFNPSKVKGLVLTRGYGNIKGVKL